MPKQHFVKTIFSFIIESLGSLSNKLLFSFHFLTSQTTSEDDNLKDEWLNPLLP